MGGSLWGGGIGVQKGGACKGHACSLGAARGKAVGGGGGGQGALPALLALS